MLTFGSLFAGIGGIDLGLERSGMHCRWQVEIDEHCQKVLTKHWPDVARFRDVRDCGRNNLESVDLITGGFPCQDISNAGKRAGIDGERSGLWREFYRIVCELRPRYVLVENVSALLGRGISRVLGDLAASGYDAEWQCIPANSVGAPHIRDRIFILAYARCDGGKRWRKSGELDGETLAYQGVEQKRQWVWNAAINSSALMADAHSERWQADGCAKPTGRDVIMRNSPTRNRQWEIEPGVDRVVNGVPSGMDGFDLTNIIMEIKNYAASTSSDPREVLRLLWEANGAPTFQKWGTRIPDDVSAAEILQFVLCKLQSIAIGKYLPQEGTEDERRKMRSLWIYETFTGTSHRSELYEQRPIEYPDALQKLSRLLAQISYKTWTGYRRAYAANRINRLRGLGNAVVPQVAEYIGKSILDFEAR